MKLRWEKCPLHVCFFKVKRVTENYERFPGWTSGFDNQLEAHTVGWNVAIFEKSKKALCTWWQKRLSSVGALFVPPRSLATCQQNEFHYSNVWHWPNKYFDWWFHADCAGISTVELSTCSHQWSKQTLEIFCIQIITQAKMQRFQAWKSADLTTEQEENTHWELVLRPKIDRNKLETAIARNQGHLLEYLKSQGVNKAGYRIQFSNSIHPKQTLTIGLWEGRLAEEE